VCCQGDDWTSHVVVDGKLITGQNPQVSTLPAVENSGLVPDMSMSLHCIGCCGLGHNALTGPQDCCNCTFCMTHLAIWVLSTWQGVCVFAWEHTASLSWKITSHWCVIWLQSSEKIGEAIAEALAA
jgi:hypothetical protein